LFDGCINKKEIKASRAAAVAAKQAFKMHLFEFNFQFELCMQIVSASIHSQSV